MNEILINEPITITWPAAQKKYEILMLQEILKNERISRVMEMGTWRGGTALLWAMMVAKYDGRVYCCDQSFDYGTLYGREYATNILREYNGQFYTSSPYAKYITEFKGNTHDPSFIENVYKEIKYPVDFMFIDGDHSYEGVKADFNNYFSLVKPGGYIAFHDIIDSQYHRDYGCYVAQFWNEIKNAFEYWELVDGNEYLGFEGGKIPKKSMGIGVIKMGLAVVKK